MQLSDLLNYVRVRLNLDNSQVVTDPQLTTFVNMSLGELDAQLANTYEDYNWNSFQTVLSGGVGTNVIPIPSDCLKVRAVHYGSPGAWITLPRTTVVEWNRWANPLAQALYPYGNNVARRWLLTGANITILPEQSGQGNYRVFYTPKFAFLVNPGDALPPYMDAEGWVEYAVASTGIKVYNRLNLPTEGFVEELARYRELVVTTANNRAAGPPVAMSNVRNISDYTFPFSGGGFGGD